MAVCAALSTLAAGEAATKTLLAEGGAIEQIIAVMQQFAQPKVHAECAGGACSRSSVNPVYVQRTSFVLHVGYVCAWCVHMLAVLLCWYVHHHCSDCEHRGG